MRISKKPKASPGGVAKKPSLLSRGAPPAGEPPFVPWFDDNDKLLAVVIARASDDPAFALRVAVAMHALSRSYARVRAELRAQTKADRPGARTVPAWKYFWLLDTYELARSRGASSDYALELVANMVSLSVSRVRNMLTEARRRRVPPSN